MRATILFFLCLVSCGISAPDTYLVQTGDLGGQYAGYVYWDRGLILIDTAPEYYESVIRAELFHAGGVNGHPVGSGHWDHSSPAAIELVSRHAWPVYLHPTPILFSPTWRAARWWNYQLGWERFIVVF